MKWFIKALRHYADFSGRARRKEYWMFVLFNLIFMFVWAFLIALFSRSYYNENTLMWVLQLSWFGLTGIPGLAVAVRRLHDLGKSGWMILVGLIPFVGGIWLLILMVTDGQAGENRFGPDPKTSPETFGDKAKSTSMGIAFTVAGSLAILSMLLSFMSPYPYWSYQNLIVSVLILAAGIAFIGSGTREKTKTALWLLLFSSGILALMNLSDMIRLSQGLGGMFVVERLIYFLSFVSIALLTVSLLFTPQNRRLIRISALAVIVLESIILLIRVRMLGREMHLENPGEIIYLLTFIQPVAFILLAWTFLSKKEESAVGVRMPEREPEPQVMQGDAALLHLYRPGKVAGAMVGYDTYLDGEKVWRAKNGSKTTIRLTNEGTAVLMAKTESRKELPLDIRFGHEYYVRCGIKMGVAMGRPKLELVDCGTGKAEFDKI